MASRTRLRPVPGSICAPNGFRAAAVFCGIKTLGTGKGSDKGQKRDLGLILSDVPAAVAGLFTTNQVCAAPVQVSRKVAARNWARGIVVNSGNANAATGAHGLRDAEAMAQLAASSVAALYDRRKSSGGNATTLAGRGNSAGSRISARDILVASTGRIGVLMPMSQVERGIRACPPLLERSVAAAAALAEAIMTSDTGRKQIAVEFKLGGCPVRIGGVCKGAGMIQPRMSAGPAVAAPLRRQAGIPRHHRPSARHATMLAFITSDVAITPALLKSSLIAAVNNSFNRITVDGDMSTNDSVIALANGLAGNPLVKSRSPDFQTFQRALDHVCLRLAQMIVRDGEGVSRFVTVHVRNAATARDAELVGRAVAGSSLVRTSWCGGDPNWGRILCATGYSGASIREHLVDIGYSAPGDATILYAFRRGRPTPVPFAVLARLTSRSEFDVHIDLHRGKSEFTMFASDLTEEYVAFNKGDITDPDSLGG